jgi:hypothetical protein
MMRKLGRILAWVARESVAITPSDEWVEFWGIREQVGKRWRQREVDPRASRCPIAIEVKSNTP